MLGVSDAKLTGSPEVAVAVNVTTCPAFCGDAIAAKEIVWLVPAVTAKLCETTGAVPYMLLPGWLAWMVQVPEASMEAVVPETEQVAGVVELKPTGKPELAVAERATDWVRIWAEIAPNVIVCPSGLTEKLWETAGAIA